MKFQIVYLYIDDYDASLNSIQQCTIGASSADEAVAEFREDYGHRCCIQCIQQVE